MRTVEIGGISPIFEDSYPPVYKAISFQAQVIKQQYNVGRFEFLIEGKKLEEFIASGMDYQKLAQEKITELLELDKTPVDAHMLEGIQRETRDIAQSVEATKQTAIAEAIAAVDGSLSSIYSEMDAIAEAASVQLSEQLVQKDLEISTLQQMIVELTLMLSMIGQPELPTEPDPDPPVDPEPPIDEDPEPPIEEPPSEIPEEPPVEDPPSDPEPTEPIPEEPTNEEFNPDVPTENSDPIGGEGGE